MTRHEPSRLARFVAQTLLVFALALTGQIPVARHASTASANEVIDRSMPGEQRVRPGKSALRLWNDPREPRTLFHDNPPAPVVLPVRAAGVQLPLQTAWQHVATEPVVAQARTAHRPRAPPKASSFVGARTNDVPRADGCVDSLLPPLFGTASSMTA